MNKLVFLLLFAALTASAQTIRIGVRDGTNAWESVLIANTNLAVRVWEWSEAAGVSGSNRAERLAAFLREIARQNAKAAWRSRKMQEKMDEIMSQEGEL